MMSCSYMTTYQVQTYTTTVTRVLTSCFRARVNLIRGIPAPDTISPLTFGQAIPSRAWQPGSWVASDAIPGETSCLRSDSRQVVKSAESGGASYLDSSPQICPSPICV